MILVEMEMATDEAGTLQSFYTATSPWVTCATCTPPHTVFEPAIKRAPSLGVSVYGDARTGGGSRLEIGELVLVNSSGEFDDWIGYGPDGRDIIVRQGTGGAYPDDFTVILRGTVQSVSATFDEVVIALQDQQAVLDRPVQTARYAGDNALPDGFEGTADDIKGLPKPRLYGKVFNVSPPCVNTSKLTYQINDGAVQSIDAVYDKGAALTPGSDYATGALLNAATVSAGTFATCKAEGYFRLGASPTGTITCDATQGASAADRTVGRILQQLAIAAGL